MAIGDNNDIFTRIKSYLPNWFLFPTPNLDALLQGFSAAFSYIYTVYINLRNQIRLKTSTGDNLDTFAEDYFGSNLLRRQGESDTAYRKRISSSLIPEGDTRQAMTAALTELTGKEPEIFEPWRPLDCGGYNVASSMGYGVAGKYGSGSYPWQCFIQVTEPQGDGLSNVFGYNAATMGGYNEDTAPILYGSASLVDSGVTVESVYEAVTRTKVAGTLCWVRIVQPNQPDDPGYILFEDSDKWLTEDGLFNIVREDAA